MITERQERVLEHGSWNIYKCQARQARTRAMHTSNAMHTWNALVLTPPLGRHGLVVWQDEEKRKEGKKKGTEKHTVKEEGNTRRKK